MYMKLRKQKNPLCRKPLSSFIVDFSFLTVFHLSFRAVKLEKLKWFYKMLVMKIFWPFFLNFKFLTFKCQISSRPDPFEELYLLVLVGSLGTKEFRNSRDHKFSI